MNDRQLQSHGFDSPLPMAFERERDKGKWRSLGLLSWNAPMSFDALSSSGNWTIESSRHEASVDQQCIHVSVDLDQVSQACVRVSG